MTIIFLLISGLTVAFVLNYASKSEVPYVPAVIPERPKAKIVNGEVVRPKPLPLSIKKMKNYGCVADGVLSNYGDDLDEQIAMINRSQCLYLHRAIESWLAPPDLTYASQIMRKIKNPNMIYGMFIAEAISKKSKFFYPDENRYFDFSKMCRPGSENVWGEHTCKPSLESEEYQKYVDYITRQAMDVGVQSFLFGQIYFQDAANLKNSHIGEVLDKMRAYAKSRDMQIAIGAQTNSITDDKYLRQFDYIEGGVGLDSQGNIEDGPCFSGKGGCWALLWNERYSSHAYNVILHLDWTGIKSDDMSTFARMDKETRARTLKNLYNFFTSKRMGFMMPYFATLHRQNGGCYGPQKRFYSASKEYYCQDEDAITKIFKSHKN